MASTPINNRLKLTPSNSPFLHRPSRSPIRARAYQDSSRLSLTRVVGTTCTLPTGFDTFQSSFAYVAGGAVVVVDVQDGDYSQRFYRARPTAIPVYATSPVPNAPSTPNSTPKANDSRRVAAHRESFYSPHDWSESPTSGKTWTQRERIKTATCLSLSRDGRYLAMGETGYAPRVLIFNLQDNSSDIPPVSISEHSFGVNAVAWSSDTRYLASLGCANDGFLYLWKIDPRNGSARLFQQNRCTSFVKGMIWVGNSLITFGVRHVKVWRVEELPPSPIKQQKYAGDGSFATPNSQRTLPGRNILLGTMLEETFICAAALDEQRAVVCTEAGVVCLLDDSSKQMKLVRLHDLRFLINCVTIRDGRAHVGGRTGQAALLDVHELINGQPGCLAVTDPSETGVLAMGNLNDNIVTIDSRRSVTLWPAGHLPGAPGGEGDTKDCCPLPGQGEGIMGIHSLSKPNDIGADFCTWSASGQIILWNVEGKIKDTINVPIEQTPSDSELDPVNQLNVVIATKDARIFITGDRLGILRVLDLTTKKCILETKAHAIDSHSVSIHELGSRLIIASCGRDRTAQLFQRLSDNTFHHFQTLEFAAKVTQVIIQDDKLITASNDRTLQVHDLVAKEDDPETIAAIPSKSIALKASPSSMVLAADGRSLFVSLLDKSISQYEVPSGKLLHTFKCTDEGGHESAVLDSLIFGQTVTHEPTFLLGLSNTDKSVRIYESSTGTFLDREWGHTVAINGVAMVDGEGSGKKVVSVGSDGTIMIWTLDLRDPMAGSMSRDPSPAKEASQSSIRPPLRRVLSKAELAEFQRPSSAGMGRRSPPRTLSRRTSRYNLSAAPLARTPLATLQTSPSSAITEDTPTRRASSDSRSGSPPPISPKTTRVVTRRPSLPAMRTTPPAQPSMSYSGTLPARKKTSATNLRASYGFGSLSMATEQTCRQLRAYRKRLASADSIANDTLAELDQELRLTVAALGDRMSRAKGAAVSEELSGILDEKLEKLVSLLDEKWGLQRQSKNRSESGKGSVEGGSRANSVAAASATTSSLMGDETEAEVETPERSQKTASRTIIDGVAA